MPKTTWGIVGFCFGFLSGAYAQQNTGASCSGLPEAWIRQAESWEVQEFLRAMEAAVNEEAAKADPIIGTYTISFQLRCDTDYAKVLDRTFRTESEREEATQLHVMIGAGAVAAAVTIIPKTPRTTTAPFQEIPALLDELDRIDPARILDPKLRRNLLNEGAGRLLTQAQVDKIMAQPALAQDVLRKGIEYRKAGLMMVRREAIERLTLAEIDRAIEGEANPLKAHMDEFFLRTLPAGTVTKDKAGNLNIIPSPEYERIVSNPLADKEFRQFHRQIADWYDHHNAYRIGLSKTAPQNVRGDILYWLDGRAHALGQPTSAAVKPAVSRDFLKLRARSVQATNWWRARRANRTGIVHWYNSNIPRWVRVPANGLIFGWMAWKMYPFAGSAIDALTYGNDTSKPSFLAAALPGTVPWSASGDLSVEFVREKILLRALEIQDTDILSARAQGRRSMYQCEDDVDARENCECRGEHTEPCAFVYPLHPAAVLEAFDRWVEKGKPSPVSFSENAKKELAGWIENAKAVLSAQQP